jgi:hypothetical protein
MTKLRTRGLWKKGPPPSIGWWPASYYRSHHDIRWWNGRYWSKPLSWVCTAEEAAEGAMLPAVYSFDVEWTQRPKDWPERSRT